MSPSNRLRAVTRLVGVLLVVGATGAIVGRRLATRAPSAEPREREAAAGQGGPDAPTDWFYMQRAFPSGVIDREARPRALRQARALRDAGPEGGAEKAAAEAWDFLGPVNIGGRITDVVADPADPTRVFVGAASGGVFRSTDNGATWTDVWAGAGSLSIGALAMDPTNPDLLWAGTGEANPGGGSIAYGGDGVWKSTDGGAIWISCGLALTNSIGRIAVDPLTPSRVFVAATGDLYAKDTDRGLYRTTDSGASWEQVLFVSDSTGCVDVAIDPANPNRVLAATWERMRRPGTRFYGGVTSGIWLSTDGGTAWTQITSGLPTAASKPGRIGIAIAPSSPSTCYAVYADSTGLFAGFYRSTDSGVTWARRTDSQLASGGFYSTFGWWFGRLWVHPTLPGTVWADGVGLYRTTNGGNAWSAVSGSLHADQHAQWIQPSNPSVMWKGNDGGAYRTTNAGTSWTHVATLPITQFYTCEAHTAEPWKAYGGAQDNGTWRSIAANSDDWGELPIGGDGQYVVVDPNATSVIYGEYQYGEFFKSVNGGASFSSAVSGISVGDRKNWSTPVVVDPASVGKPQTTLYYGANRLYRSTNSATSWSAVSGNLSDGFPGANGVTYGTITTVSVSPLDSATIWVGTDDANVWVSTNAGGSWTQVDGALPERWVTRVAADPSDAASALVTFSGYRDADPLAHVFETTDRGATWSDVSGDLPDAPVNDLVIDPGNPSALYAATDVGVFFSLDRGAQWFALGTALPEGVVVTDLEHVAGTPPRLLAATYGRSMYSLPLPGATDVAGADPGLGAGSRDGLALAPNVPNPWRDQTRIRFALPRSGPVQLEIINPAGERVRTLLDGSREAGDHEVVWDGRDAAGRRAAAGAYLYRLTSGGQTVSRKMILAP